MKDFPHHYQVQTQASTEGTVSLSSSGLASLETAPLAEFGGPGDRWSPETLLVGAVADCFVLSFRAVARASQLEWISLDCRAEGVLDRIDKVTQFTEVIVHATLRVPAGTNVERAERLLERAEQVCLISNSLKATKRLEACVEVAS